MLVLNLVDAAGVGLTRDIAFGLYAGLVRRHTGSFKYSATTTRPWHEAGGAAAGHRDRAGHGGSRTVGTGLPSATWGCSPAVLGRATLEPDAAGGNGLVWTSVTRRRPGRAQPVPRRGRVRDRRAAPHRRSGSGPSSSRSPTTGCGRRPPGPRARWTWAAPAPGWAAAGTATRPGVTLAGSAEDAIRAAAAGLLAEKQLAPMPRDARGNAPSGLIVVDKPGGLTSHDVVARIRRLAGTRRVGHAGTLDPMATGVLVVGVEKATRLLGHLTLTDKEYQAHHPGSARPPTTGDAEGTVTAGPARPATCPWPSCRRLRPP